MNKDHLLIELARELPSVIEEDIIELVTALSYAESNGKDLLLKCARRFFRDFNLTVIVKEDGLYLTLMVRPDPISVKIPPIETT